MSWVSEFCKSKRVEGFATPCYYPDCHCASAGDADYDPRANRENWTPSKKFNEFYSEERSSTLGTEVVSLDPPYYDILKASEWTCKLIGNSLTIKPLVGSVPNWFHRLMQRIILGFIWIKD